MSPFNGKVVNRSKRRPALRALLLGFAGAAGAALPAAADEAPKAFTARYQVQWRGINVGTSDLILKPHAGSSEFDFESHSNARGIFHLVYGEEIVQASTFAVVEGHARPRRYRGEDGTPKTDKDVLLNFDWTSMRVAGTAEDKAISLALKPLTQDPMSVQIELMMSLISNRIPTTLWLADKNEIKEYLYSDEGTAQLKTSLGELATRVLSSRRPGGNRVTRLWFAPSLGNVPVKAERTRDGRLDFAMNIRTLTRP